MGNPEKSVAPLVPVSDVLDSIILLRTIVTMHESWPFAPNYWSTVFQQKPTNSDLLWLIKMDKKMSIRKMRKSIYVHSMFKDFRHVGFHDLTRTPSLWLRRPWVWCVASTKAMLRWWTLKEQVAEQSIWTRDWANEVWIQLANFHLLKRNSGWNRENRWVFNVKDLKWTALASFPCPSIRKNVCHVHRLVPLEGVPVPTQGVVLWSMRW